MDKCPKCGAAADRHPSKLTFQCGSYIYPNGEMWHQSDLCETSCELAAAKKELARLNSHAVEALRLLNDKEYSDAMKEFRRAFGFVNKFVCCSCGNAQDGWRINGPGFIGNPGPSGCEKCGSGWHEIKVVREGEADKSTAEKGCPFDEEVK